MVEHDFLPKVDAIRTKLAALLVQPPKQTLRRAIHDGWRTILQPRGSAMMGRLDDLILAKWWSFGDDDKADWLVPKGWDNQTGDLAVLFTELGGCLEQYLRIRVTWHPQTKFGFFKAPNAPFGTAAQVAAEKEKQVKDTAATQKKLDEMYGKALADVLEDWRERQDVLTGLLKSLRDLSAELELAEEERLRIALATGSNKPGSKPSVIAGQLDEMKLARIDLTHFPLAPTNDFGSLLRKWRGIQKKVDAVFPEQ
jgi:hypothetical protein